MGYYIRFLLEDDGPLSVDMIMAGLRAEDAGGPEVAARLASVTAIVAARVLLQGRSGEETLKLLDPLWD